MKATDDAKTFYEAMKTVSPVILRSGPADTALIMPMRIRDEWHRDDA